MVFSSISFLFYFLPLVLALYYVFSFSRPMQNVWLLIASLIFYAWGEPIFVCILLVSVLVNYILGLLEQRWRDASPPKAKVVVVICCFVNLGILFVFKYLAFVISIINDLCGTSILKVPEIALPIGISFYTFQALSYVIDIYRKKTDCQKNPLYVGLYISFFPQLIAGPIVRYNTISEQIKYRKSSLEQFTTGTTRFVVGLSKKVLLANNLAIVADTIFRLTQTTKEQYSVPVLMAWLGAVCYMLQIFFDFSAYSDMAIGLGQMFGFQFEENFNYPYISKSVGEFWRRWHISLGTWFKEYVYFPLGGSRTENKDKMVRNTFIVWLLTGVWHGAYWTFIIWGVYNFAFIMIERLIGFERREGNKILRHCYLVLVTLFGWVMFRADTLYELNEYYGNMFGLNNNAIYGEIVGMFIKEYAVVLVVAIVLCTPIVKVISKKVDDLNSIFLRNVCKVISAIGICGMFSYSVICMVKGGYNPFIYFNF